MSSEAITRNDLMAILNEVLPPKESYPKDLGYIINSEASTSTTGAWVYTGLSFTVPAEHRYLVTIAQTYSHGNPRGIGLAMSSSSSTPTFMNLNTSGSVYRLTALLEPGTWYIFTYRAATGSNNYSVQAIDFM